MHPQSFGGILSLKESRNFEGIFQRSIERVIEYFGLDARRDNEQLFDAYQEWLNLIISDVQKPLFKRHKVAWAIYALIKTSCDRRIIAINSRAPSARPKLQSGCSPKVANQVLALMVAGHVFELTSDKKKRRGSNRPSPPLPKLGEFDVSIVFELDRPLERLKNTSAENKYEKLFDIIDNIQNYTKRIGNC